MNSPISYDETPEFKKDFKKLAKKFRTLPEDLELVKSAVIELNHVLGINNLSAVLVEGLCAEEVKIYKIRKFACKALKGRGSQTGIRVIYAYHVKTHKVDFIEIYFKADQAIEDKERIKIYLRNIASN
jgi:mRNA-degrading endonuclease RelE of RelBE toxin-antitoxin system